MLFYNTLFDENAACHIAFGAGYPTNIKGGSKMNRTELLAKGRTTLTIAHRLTTIKNADRILVLGKSGIEEEGRHEELLAKKGIYYRLWNGLVSGQTL